MSNCTVVRVRPLGTDDNGDPIEGTPSELTIPGCTFAPRLSSNIDARGRAGVIVGLTLYTPPEPDIVHGDLLRITGAGQSSGTYEIDGEVGVWDSTYSDWQPGAEIALRRAAG